MNFPHIFGYRTTLAFMHLRLGPTVLNYFSELFAHLSTLMPKQRFIVPTRSLFGNQIVRIKKLSKIIIAVKTYFIFKNHSRGRFKIQENKNQLQYI